MVKHSLLLTFFIKLLSLHPISSIDFILNDFNSSNISLYGNATIESNILWLTNTSVRNMGRAFFQHKIPTRSPKSSKFLPFYTSFIFSLAPSKSRLLYGHGYLFVFSPLYTIKGAESSQNLGLLKRNVSGDPENHMFGVEFDVVQNQEFNDIDNNHVGIDVNLLISISSYTAGYWVDNSVDEFKGLKLSSGLNYQVWVDYSNFLLNVTIVVAGKKRPIRPLLSTSLNLSNVLLDEMYVGFTAATGYLVQTHRILSWSFRNSNPRVGDELITSNLPSFIPHISYVFVSKGLRVFILVGTVFLICCGFGICFVPRKRKKGIEAMEEWEVEYWPHRITYQDIYDATEGFLDEHLIGGGGAGKVYKGIMLGVEVAVKCISYETAEGMREFLAEISRLRWLKHKILVGFKSWCKRENENLILVYEFMENGSVDKRIFYCNSHKLLSWEDRVRLLMDIAEGVFYLHEGWESRVLQRDIKASNVMLDKDMNGRLGDFGLARMQGHTHAPTTTCVIGTPGYMAPEIIQSGCASAKTDVYGFGVLILEVVCGRGPIEDGKPFLVDWIWGMMETRDLMDALDPRLKAKEAFDSAEVEKILHLGLLCAYTDPLCRPTMRQVLNLLNRTSPEEDKEGEEMEMCLLNKIKATAMWPRVHHAPFDGKYPTFSCIQRSVRHVVIVLSKYKVVLACLNRLKIRHNSF